MSEFKDEVKALQTAFASILKDIMASKDKRVEELCEEIGRLKEQLEMSNEMVTKLMRKDE